MLPEPAARVQAALDAACHGLQVVVHDASTATALDAAAAAGCEPGQIVKSLLFIANEAPVLLLVAGDRRADTAKLAPLLGVPRKRVRMATPDEVLSLTGYEVGGVPPLGHPQPLETILDASLDRFQELYAAAGTGNTVFRVDRAVLVELTRARVADVSS
jgi:prolyl-tRNA editing enzyme YbaK/EbsC (Cys-tRNA(Pro) deacylase)